MNTTNYQSLVDQLADFIELRFGVYLDTIIGFQYNLQNFKRSQLQVAQHIKLSIEELDKLPFCRGNGPPSSNLEECRQREIHRMSQGEFKSNNSPSGANYDLAIENCLSDIYNYWNGILKKLNLSDARDEIAFPVMAYLRKLRNRVQHDLYRERLVTEDAIEMEKVVTGFSFPVFTEGQRITLSKEVVEALIFEVRSQFNSYLIPYINNYLKSFFSSP